MNVVVMPTFARPEMLALALEKLRKAKNCPDDIRIFLDTCSDTRLNEVDYVRDNYFPEAMIFRAGAHAQVPSGMWNVLNALKQGYKSGADRVFLIEEDVLVGSEFFNWHETAQQTGVYLATCGRRMLYLPEYDQYTNTGSCFSRDMLGLIVEHIHDDLFADRRKYLEGTFGRMTEVSDLDDGLIRRFAKSHGLKVKYPDTPQCAHIGFRAYNHYANWINSGSIDDKIIRLRQILVETSNQDRFTRDFEPVLP